MAVISRALHWFAGSRFRIAGALAALALVAVGLVVLQGDDHGGQQVDASSSDVRAGRGATTTTPGDTTPTTAGLRRGGRVEITTRHRAPATITRPGKAITTTKGTHSGPDRHARKAARTQTTTAPGPNRGAPPTTTTPTTAPAPSSTTTTSTTAPPPPPVQNGRIVFVEPSDVGGDTTRIAVMDADGGNVTPLTDGTHVDAHPAWSPDGSRIAFDRFDNGARRVFVMAADGSGVHQVAGADGSATSPTWSPDGARLAYLAGTDVAVVDLSSGQATVVGTNVAAEGAGVAWSPDGSLLAWAGTTGIGVAAPDGTGARQLTTGDDHDPAWSPDGSRLLVRRADTVVTVDRAGAVSAPIATGDGFADLEWSPDGQRFLYDCTAAAATAVSLCVRNIDGSGRVVLDATASDGDWLAAAGTTTTSTTQP
jgi:hypothetical protein